MDKLISEVVSYGLKHDLVHADDKTYVVNRLLDNSGPIGCTKYVPAEVYGESKGSN